MIPQKALDLIGPRTATQIAEVLDTDGQDPEKARVRERATQLSARLGIPSRISDEFLSRYARASNDDIAGQIAAASRSRPDDPEWMKIRDIVEHLYAGAWLASPLDPVRASRFSKGLSETLGVSPAVAFYALAPAGDGRITMPHCRVVSRGGHAAKVELAGGRLYSVVGHDTAEGRILLPIYAMTEEAAVEEMEIHMAEIGCRDIDEVVAVPIEVDPEPDLHAAGLDDFNENMEMSK